MGALIFLYLYLCVAIVTIYLLSDLCFWLITGDGFGEDDGEEDDEDDTWK